MIIWNLPFYILFQQASTAEQAVINLTKCRKFERKCTKMRLAAGLRPVPLMELKRSPGPDFLREGTREAGAALRLGNGEEGRESRKREVM